MNGLAIGAAQMDKQVREGHLPLCTLRWNHVAGLIDEISQHGIGTREIAVPVRQRIKRYDAITRSELHLITRPFRIGIAELLAFFICPADLAVFRFADVQGALPAVEPVAGLGCRRGRPDVLKRPAL